jgi:hypothetical protein
VFGDSIRWEFEAHSVSRVRYVVIAVERYSLAHGKLPASLADLVPGLLTSVPTDMFSGHALQFHPTPHGYCVYSVGPDEIDNGGNRYDKLGGEFRDGTDIAFTIER